MQWDYARKEVRNGSTGERCILLTEKHIPEVAQAIAGIALAHLHFRDGQSSSEVVREASTRRFELWRRNCEKIEDISMGQWIGEESVRHRAHRHG